VIAGGKVTTDHVVIKRWVKSRQGYPVIARKVLGNKISEQLHISFSCDDEPALEMISWDKFFELFEREKLAFLYQDDTKEEEDSNFCLFL
jgi:hypothetical protein